MRTSIKPSVEFPRARTGRMPMFRWCTAAMRDLACHRRADRVGQNPDGPSELSGAVYRR